MLSDTTNPDNYVITAVDGLLQVNAIALTVPSGLCWSSVAGTATWVSVIKNNLVVNYALDLYAFDGNEYTKINDEQIVIDTNSYDFAPAIIAHAEAVAEQGKTYSYTYKIQTLSAGGTSMSGYTDSEVSDYQAMMYTAQVSINSDSSMVSSADMGGNDSMILLNGQRVAISALTKDGYVFDTPAITCTGGFTIGTPVIQTPEAHKQSSLTVNLVAKLNSSLLGCTVTVHTVDEKPWISSFTAENAADYQSVKLSFTAADGNNLAGWAITQSAAAPSADDSCWNNLTDQGAAAYNGSQTVTDEGTYYIYVKDGSGSVVTYPLSMSVYRITFDPGAGTGTMQSILKAQNTVITLPACTFTNDGNNFQNWIGSTGRYSDGGSYSANANDRLVAGWTDEHYDYTVKYFYMNADGTYSDTPDSERTFSGVYGETVTTASDGIQYPRTGFELDDSAEYTSSIALSGSGQELNVYYRRIKYNVYFRYTLPGDTEPTVITKPYYYGADLSAAFNEKPGVAGYDFIGWLFGSAGTQPTEMPAHDVTVTGSFTPKSTKYHIRYYTQDVDAANRVCRDTYTLMDDISEDIIALHDDSVVFGEEDAQRIDGFTFAGIYVTHGATSGTSLPENTSVSVSANADYESELYINVYYSRNSNSVKLNVWQDAVGVTGNLKYEYTWTVPYEATLETSVYPTYNIGSWPHSDDYELADYVDWSTGTVPSAMPAGDVTVTRQFVSKVTGLYKVEVYLETETEGEYSKLSFSYYNNVGKTVSVGADDSFTINYNNYANSINYFQYYQIRNVTDEEIANNVIQGADGGTLTTGVVTNTNNGQEPLVMRIFFERKICQSTINYYYNDGTGSNEGTKFYTIVKQSKWGSSHYYNYEPLALFDSALNLNETSNIVSQEVVAQIGGVSPIDYDFKNNNYVVSYGSGYSLDGSGHWKSYNYNTVESLNSTQTGPMGYANNYVNVYYTCTKPTEQFYIDVVYNSKGLTHGVDRDIPLKYTDNGTEYKVRLANEAIFYKDSQYVIDGEYSEYPGLGNANANANNPDAVSGKFVYDKSDSNIVDGYTRIEVNGKPCFLSNDGYLYIAMTDNRFFWGNRTSYSMDAGDPGYSDVTEFLAAYKEQWSETDKSAANASVYNRGYGSTNVYGNGTLRITFINGAVNHIYYNLSGTICAKHEYADGTVVDPDMLGCEDGTFPTLAGREIVWYKDSDFTEIITSEFTLDSSITLYGRYEKATILCYENVYYELADPVTVGEIKYSYITENDIEAFADDEKFTSEESSEVISFVDGSGSTVTLTVKTTTYKYNGEVVMISKERPTLSFAEISMNSSAYGKKGMYYDEANSLNNMVGYCQYESVSLRAYFARCLYEVTVKPNHSDANTAVSKHNYGSHVVIENPQRAGYDFDGWTWYRYDSDSGEYIAWTSGAPAAGAQQTEFVLQDFSVMAVASWKPAVFDQDIIHYFQTGNLTFETDAIDAIVSGECTATAAEIVIDDVVHSGTVYTNGGNVIGVSVVLEGSIYYYTNAVAEQGQYVVSADEIAAIRQTISVKQEAQKAVSDCVRSVTNYSFSYALYQYKDIICSYSESDSFEVCAGMKVDYFYKRANDLEIGAEAYITDGGSGNVVIIGGGSHYIGETFTLNARIPAGFTFLGWYKAADVLENYPDSDKMLSGYTLKEGWADAVPVSTTAEYSVKVKGAADYIALVEPDAVAEPSITITGKDSLVYGYSVSAENAVNALVSFGADASSANYVYSYQWYRDGEKIEGANSATYLIPQGWNAGEYNLTCEVTIKRRDNQRTKTYSSSFTVEVEKSDIKFKAVNYEGYYDKQKHSISLEVSTPESGYVVYYSESPLDKDNYLSGQTGKPEYTDVHVTEVSDGNGGTVYQRAAYTVYYYIKDNTGNFNDVSGTAEVNIKPVQLSVSAGTETYYKIYDGNASVLGTITAEGTDLYNLVHSENVYKINGLVAGDQLAHYIISCDADFNKRHVQGANAVTLSNIQLASRDGDIIYNYIFDSEYSVKLSGYIEPMPIEIVWDTDRLVYNGTAQCPDYTVATEIPEVDRSNLSWSVSGKNTNVGVYSASVNFTSTDSSTDIIDFRLQNGTVSYTIVGRPITIKPDDREIVYDGKSHTLSPFYVTEGNLVGGDKFTATYSGTGKNAGTYKIKAKNVQIVNNAGVDITNNYAITAAEGELVITPRPVTVSGITAKNKNYDGNTAAELDISAAELANVVQGDTLSLDASKLTGEFENSAIGKDKRVTITYSEGALSGASGANYALDTENSQTVTQADILGKEISVKVKNTTVTYGENTTFDIELSGFLSQQELDAFDKSGVTYKVGTSKENAVPYTTTLAAGTYNIYADVSSFSAENYYFTPVAGTLTIAPRKLAVKAVSTADITKVYDGGDSASVSASDYSFTVVADVSDSGIVNGDTVSLKYTAKYNSKNVTEANAVNMTGLSLNNTNYKLVTESFDIAGHITPMELTVTAKDVSVTYGAASVPTYEAEYSDFAADEDESVLSGTLSFNCDYDPAQSGKREVVADGYTITPSGLLSDNYVITFSAGKLTVNKATIVITAVDESVTYGKDGMPTFTYTHSTPLAYGESYDSVVTGSVTYTCTAQTTNDGTSDVVSSKPGDYAITPIVTGLSAQNYSFTPKDGKLTVNKYTVTVQGITLTSKVYDGSANLLASQVVLTGAVLSGMPKLDEDYFGDNAELAKVAVTGSYSDKNAGTGKTVNITITAGTYLADRCIIDLVNSQKTATADISKRPLVITAEDKTVKHGSSAPAFTAKFEGNGTAASGFAANESAESGDVTFACDYYAPDGNGLYTEAGEIDITPTALAATATLIPDNYDITFNKGKLTVSAAQLTAPNPVWSTLAPGVIDWNTASGIGNVSVSGYHLSLYKDGSEIIGGAADVASDVISYDYSSLIRANGEGAYTVKIKAIASLTGNASNKNVIDSAENESAELCAAKVVFEFASDNVSKSGMGREISVNNSPSYIMIAGEQNIAIAAQLKNGTGYTIKSVKSDCSKLSVAYGSESARNGAAYSDTISLGSLLAKTDYNGTITIKLELAARAATLKVLVTANPASATYGYAADAAPVITAVASAAADDTIATGDYIYSFNWTLKEYNTETKNEILSAKDGTNNISDWTFPTGKSAKSIDGYYKVRCIVTAERKDNGEKITAANTWMVTSDYVVAINIERAPFESEVVLEGWKYGESRNTPTVTNNPENTTITYQYVSADVYDANSAAAWQIGIPTDAGRWYVRAVMAESENYSAYTTPNHEVEIGLAKLDTPDNLAMGTTAGQASYGKLSWDSVTPIKENNGVNSASEVSVMYRVKLYRFDETIDDWTLVKTYTDTSETTGSITEDIQAGGKYRFSVTAISKNDEGTLNCKNSDEAFSDEITVGGSITAAGNGTLSGSKYTMKYDGTAITLTANFSGDNNTITGYRWFKNGQAIANAVGKTYKPTHVNDSGIYTCEILAGENTYFTPYIEVAISKRNVTLTSASGKKTYDGSPLTKKTVTDSADGFASGEGASYNVTGTITYTGEADNTFTYTLWDNTLASDYLISCVEGTLTIEEVEDEIIITAASDSREYNGTALTSSKFTYTSGILVEGDVLYVQTGGTVTHVGKADNTVTSWKVMRGETDVTANYTFGTPVKGTLEITKAKVTITAASDSREYNGTALTNSGWEITHGAIASGDSISVTVTGSQLDAGSSANSAAVSMTQGSESDYEFTCEDGTLEITPVSAEITITAASDSKQYDGTALTADGFSFTQGILVQGEELTAVVEGTITDAGETANVIQSYKVMRGQDDVTANYTFVDSVDGKLTVTPVYIGITTGSAEKQYDGTALKKHTYSVTTGAFIGFDSITVDFTGEQTKVGTSDNTAVAYVSVGTAGNYDIHILCGTLQVKPNAEIITITAGDRTEVYSSAEVTQTAYTYTEGILAAGDSLYAVTEGGRTDVGESANRIGSYIVTNSNGEDVTNCYTFGPSVDGKITVTPKAVTITVSNAVKKYGADDPVFTGDVSGLCGENDLGEIRYFRTNTEESIGKYTGVLTAEYTANDNYTVDVRNGDFEITVSDMLAVAGTDYNGIYDGSYHGTAAAVNIEEYGPGGESLTTISYSTDGGLTWSVDAPQLKDVGTLSVLVKAENDSYTTAQSTYTISGLVACETVGFEVTGSITEIGSTPNTYELTFAADDNEFTAKSGNYTVSEDIGTLTVTPEDEPDEPDDPDIPDDPVVPDDPDEPDIPIKPDRPRPPILPPNRTLPKSRTIPTNRILLASLTLPTNRAPPTSRALPTSRTPPMSRTSPMSRALPTSRTPPMSRALPKSRTLPTSRRIQKIAITPATMIIICPTPARTEKGKTILTPAQQI